MQLKRSSYTRQCRPLSPHLHHLVLQASTVEAARHVLRVRMHLQEERDAFNVRMAHTATRQALVAALHVNGLGLLLMLEQVRASR